MKKNLLIASSNSYNVSQQKTLRFLLLIQFILVFGLTTTTRAQCLGPYQVFESCRAKGAIGTANTMANDGWLFSASSNAISSGTSARSGAYFIQLPSAGQSIVTPLLVNPDKFQFYYRSSSAVNNATFRVEYSTDNTFPDTVGAPTITGPAFTTSGTSYSSTGQIDLSAYSNIYVRIRSLATTPMITQPVTGTAGTFTALSGGTTVAINSDDAISGAVPIGFNFAYNGTLYNNVYASSNGFLSFNSSATSTPTNNLTSPAASLLPMVAPLWDDLDGTSGAASYSTSGTSGSRIFTFEWLNWEWGSAANTPVISFQVKLYEANGKVEFIYRSDAGAVNTASGGASVGITGNNSGEYRSLSSLTATTSSIISETSTITAKPTSGQTFGFAGPGAAVFVDDFSWTSRTTSQNIIIVPDTVAAASSYTCTQTVPATTSYSFYDQGGLSDCYSKSQTETIIFAPQNGTDRVKVTFNSFNVENTTNITIYNGNGTGGTVLLPTYTGTSNPTTLSYTSTNPGDYITVKFVTTTTATPAAATTPGYDITVQCISSPIITSLSATSGCVGSTLVITGTNLASATGVTINGTPVTIIGINTSTSVTVTPAAGSNGTVTVTTAGGSGTSAANYTSNALPTISSQPSSGTQTNCLSGSATALSVTAAAGSGAISKYEWYSNTSASIIGATLVATNTTAATTDSYTPATTSAGTLYYYVVVTNSNGCTLTSSFSGAITVNSPVTITTPPSSSSQTVCVGSSITALSVTATGGGLSYQWYSNAVSSNSGGTLLAGATSSSYTPSNASAMATTYYYCVVSNGAPCNSLVTSAVSGGITVNALPTTVTVSTPGTYCTSTTLTAANGGSGTIYWQNTTSGGTSIATPSASQSVSASGTYYFRAQSAGCWGTQGSATVTINTVPTFPSPSAGSGATTSSITANWVASAGATGYYLDVATDNAFTSIVSGYNNLSVGNVLTYSVTGLSSGTTYYYRVRAANACGSSTTFGIIT